MLADQNRESVSPARTPLLERLERRARNQVAYGRVRARRLTARWRTAPDFMLIGTMRGGTSSLYKYLSSHPCILPSVRKEVEYFTRNYHSREDAWYRSHFPLKLHMRATEYLRGSSSTFEATPHYLFDPRTPARIKQVLPDLRFLVVLRDPVDRAISHHEHQFRLGMENLPLEEALAQEPARLGPDLARMAEDDSYFGFAYDRYSYVERGKYARQLRGWLREFPRERFLILESKLLYQDTAMAYDQIIRFLGLPKYHPNEYKNYSYRRSVPQRQQVDPATRERLRECFVQDSAQLPDILGWKPSWVE